ncbi:MAG: NTP transferase domain-containing protein, partial [Thermodesulfovibrio sp.]
MDVVILAAGMGTRMKSTLPKVLHRIFDKPIIDYVIECAQSLKPASILVVVNPSLTEVIQYLNSKAIKIVFQNEPKGTANALYSALPYIKNEKILILNGDTPLIKKDTLLNFLKIFDEKAQDLA